MPFGRRRAEALGKARQQLGRERNLGQQHQRLLARRQRRRYRVEINLGLARAGDAVQQRHGKSAAIRLGGQILGRDRLRRGQRRAGKFPIGLGRKSRRKIDGFEQSLRRQVLHHAGAAGGAPRELGRGGSGAAGQRLEHAAPRRRQRLGRVSQSALARPAQNKSGNGARRKQRRG